MKILYITNYNDIVKASGGFVNDYLNDLCFYGLRENLGDDVVDSTQIISLYKEYEGKISKQNLWGGFTSFWLIGENNIDRNNIEKKIKDKYYDYIIYGAVRRCLQYYDIVSKIYPNDKVIMIDGNDEQDLSSLYDKHLYFKRELNQNHPNLLPITFSIPTCKITNKELIKEKEFGIAVPGDKSTYVFTNEQEYFDDYNKSYYGVTMKKAGWDCMRHYEILGNRCIPYFINLDDCPKQTLFNFPKKLIKEGIDIIDHFDEKNYFNILNEVFEYTKNNLTTKAIGNYILSKL